MTQVLIISQRAQRTTYLFCANALASISARRVYMGTPIATITLRMAEARTIRSPVKLARRLFGEFVGPSQICPH